MRRLFLLPVLAVAAMSATAAPPAAPSDVVLFAPGANMPQVSWKDNSSDEEMFVIEYRDSSSTTFVSFLNNAGNFPPNSQVARFTGGGPNPYVFRIKAVRGIESSAWVQSQPLLIPNADFAFGVVTDQFQYASDGIAGIEGDSFEYTVPTVGSATPTSFFLEGLPGCSIDNTGKITGTLPATGVSSRGFYGAIVEGKTFKQPFYLRSESSETTPQVANPIAPVSFTVGTEKSVDLSKLFRDPELPVWVRFNTTLGSFEAVLYDAATPLTVANFLSYLRSGTYTSSVVHRSVGDFIVQAGGFNQLADRTTYDWKTVSALPQLRNEPGFSNERGTIAMAKLPGNPDSATSQWFVSTGAANPANLDFQNGGFTVFGRVLGDGMDVVDALNDLPLGNYTLRVQTGANTGGNQNFTGVPVNNATAPGTLTPALETAIQSVEELQPLTLSIESNSNPAIVTATLNGKELDLNGIAIGSSTISLRATNTDMETVDFNLEVTVKAVPPPPTPPRDTTAPTAKITGPATKGKYPTSKKLRISGSATDNIGLARWQYRLNGGSWKSGGSLSGRSKSFSKTVSGFKRNGNTLEVRVYDTSGRVSSTAKRKITLK